MRQASLLLVLAVAVAFGGCPWFARVLPERALPPGRAAYLEDCAFCHGTRGWGDGEAAARLPVPPADFSSGYFKLRSTPSGELPTDDDLLATITRGIGGSGMPSFRHLPRETRQALVVEVKRLARPRDGGESHFANRPPKRIVEVPPRPPLRVEMLAKGRKLYVDLGCPACHGPEGRGDGSAAAELVDHAKRPLPPTDFTLGVYLGGADPRGLYLRIATGLNGTPMPEYGDDLMSADERWALVEYLLSLAGR
ncbi:MAG: c-type cytochrome [Candidatus Binatia bacterium]